MKFNKFTILHINETFFTCFEFFLKIHIFGHNRISSEPDLETNKKQFLAEKILKEFGVSNFFNYILGSDGKTPLKPEIEMPEKCLHKFRVPANQVVFVGDSENDILPAKQLGMFSVHVTYGYGKLKEKIRADLVIDEIKELRKIF